MLRKELDQEIEIVKALVNDLDGMVAHAIEKSALALKDNDLAESQMAFAFDQRINRLRFEIETSVMVVIATQQPIAHDLRVLTAVLSVNKELERVGDYAKGISRINLRSGGLSLPKILVDLNFMAGLAADMLHDAVEAFLLEDADRALKIAQQDREIDALYHKIYYDALDLVMDDSRNIERVNYVLWAAHNLERIGDRAINVCERTIFVATGEMAEIREDLEVGKNG